jgi:hypothetical protein
VADDERVPLPAGDVPEPPTGRRPRTPVTVAIVVLAALGASWLTATAPGLSHDVVSAIQAYAAPPPSAEIVALAAAAHLADEGRALFYGARPQVLGAKAFTGRCADGQTQRTVAAGTTVGCFLEAANSIVLYEPADPRLQGSVVESAAHETLHAAWAQLRQDEQSQLTPLLEAAVASLAADDPIREQIAASVGTHPDHRPTELFAYVGTQVWRPGGLAAQLEATYARFISDRAALVAVHTGWQGLLDGMGADIQAASQALATREGMNAQRQAQYTVDSASVDYYRRAYQAKAAEVAAMSASRRERLQLAWVWWDGTKLPMAPAEQTLAAAAALLARDQTALPARETAIHADVAAAVEERARVQGLAAGLQALQAQLDPAASAS